MGVSPQRSDKEVYMCTVHAFIHGRKEGPPLLAMGGTRGQQGGGSTHGHAIRGHGVVMGCLWWRTWLSVCGEGAHGSECVERGHMAQGVQRGGHMAQ